jgi:hypothetical protein
LFLPIEACLFTVKHQQQEQVRSVLEISGALAIKYYNYNYQVKARQVERQSKQQWQKAKLILTVKTKKKKEKESSCRKSPAEQQLATTYVKTRLL